MSDPKFKDSENVWYLNQSGQIKDAFIDCVLYQGDVGNEYAILIDDLEAAEAWEDELFRLSDIEDVVETAAAMVKERYEALQAFMKEHNLS